MEQTTDKKEACMIQSNNTSDAQVYYIKVKWLKRDECTFFYQFNAYNWWKVAQANEMFEFIIVQIREKIEDIF